MAIALAGAVLALPACDSDPSGSNGDRSSVLVGTVEGGEAGGMMAAGQGATQASVASAGTLRGDGSLDILAEAQVSADGSFRIEGVPAGRAGLVVRAESDSGEEVGRVIVHQETIAEAETSVAPINASSSLHAQVVLAIHGGNPHPAASAEVGLRMMTSSEAASTMAQGQVSALASAVASAQSTKAAVLASVGSELDAAARAELVLAAMVDLEQNLSAGAQFQSAHRAFVEGTISTLIDAGVDARSLAAAEAAAATSIQTRLSSEDAVHFETLRTQMRANLEARARLLAQADGGTAGVADVAAQVIAELRAGVEAAATVAELRAAVTDTRAGTESRLTSAVVAGLPGLPIDLISSIEAELRIALVEAELWGSLEAAASSEAKAAAVSSWATNLEARVQGWIATLPSEVSDEVSVSASVVAFAALGAGPAFR
ncbi:MAG: hypothetical protein EA351_09345 [Gemmatimonadales bacterium]|nr:MAG: hypothetical protein EA351_09345 [Gemmatimonadales bacterium]